MKEVAIVDRRGWRLFTGEDLERLEAQTDKAIRESSKQSTRKVGDH